MKTVMFIRGLLAIILLLALGVLAACGDNEQTQSKPAAVTKEDVKIKSKYSIEYLNKMIGGSKLSDSVTLQLNNDYPLKIEYKAIDKVDLAFILAPRVEND